MHLFSESILSIKVNFVVLKSLDMHPTASKYISSIRSTEEKEDDVEEEEEEEEMEKEEIVRATHSLSVNEKIKNFH
jgi:hypothetical protein